ncbi:MAG TPA: hypothetical protein VNJ07_05615, partial [Chitinophagales bacterium]|nr:hypothetical protein [Chitinophagales bacterium]
DALISRHILKKKISTASSARYGFPIKIAILLLGLIYFFPGFWKLWGAGFDWIFKCNMQYQMYVRWSALNDWLPFFRLDNYPVLIVLCSIFVIAFEISFIFLAIRPAYRLWLILGGLIMHTGIFLFMKISFFALMLAYPVLVDWEMIYKKLRNGRAKQAAKDEINFKWKEIKWLILLSAVLLGGNIIAGIAKVKSYPFACYPTFDYMVPHKKDFIYYEGYKNGILTGNTHQIKERIFKRRPPTNIESVENNLLRSHHQSDNTQVAAIIKQIFPFKSDFEEYDSIVVHCIEKELVPERKNNFTKKIRLGVFLPHEQVSADSVLTQ